MHTCLKPTHHILAPSTSSSTQPTLDQSAGSEAGAAHGAENGPSNSEADINTNTTTTVLDPAGLDQVRSNESTSWWNYVGWTSASTSTETTASTLTNVASIQASVANVSQELNLESTTLPAAIGNPNEGSAANMGLGSESGLVDDTEEGKAVESPEKAKEEVQGGGQSAPISSWYSAWGWYSSANANGPVQPESESLEVKNISEDPQVDAPLPVVRSDPTSAPLSETHGGDTPSVSAPPPPPINPITTSMEANGGGWASFFSSRTLIVKTLGYGSGGRIEDVKRDEDGMEVMDLDDDEDERRDVEAGALLNDPGREDGVRGKAMSSSPILIPKTRPNMLKPSDSQDSQTSRVELQISGSTGNKGERSVSKSPAKSTVSSTPEKGNSISNVPIPVPIHPTSSSPSSRDGNNSQSLPKTPTTSKKTNNTRTASPAPSKKSVSSQPPPPNLVLPTWKQTFNTAPRNVVLPVANKPERYLEDQTVGGKLLGKTMRFVSGVLFAKDGRDGSPQSERQQIKGKEREMERNRDIDFKKWEEERFREFGKELPKSWQIKEGGLDADATPTSHIPIFKFGSPKSTKKGDLRSTNKESQIGVGASGVDENEGQSHSHEMKDVLRGCKRVVVIGIHGWFPGTFSIQISFE